MAAPFGGLSPDVVGPQHTNGMEEGGLCDPSRPTCTHNTHSNTTILSVLLSQSLPNNDDDNDNEVNNKHDACTVTPIPTSDTDQEQSATTVTPPPVTTRGPLKRMISLKEFLDKNNAALNNMVEDDDDGDCDCEDSVAVWEVEDIDDRSVISFWRTMSQHHQQQQLQQTHLEQQRVVVLSDVFLLDDDDHHHDYDEEVSYDFAEVEDDDDGDNQSLLVLGGKAPKGGGGNDDRECVASQPLHRTLQNTFNIFFR